MIKNFLKNLIVVSTFFNGALAMSLDDIGKVCLFSKISGIIKLNGQVVSNAKLIRTVNLSKDIVDETITNESGRFELPVIYTQTISKYLPQEFSASQKIVVYYAGKEYRIWSAVKRKPQENIESRGKPLIVKCELNSEETMIKVNNGPIFSLCTWDVEPDKRSNAF